MGVAGDSCHFTHNLRSLFQEQQKPLEGFKQESDTAVYAFIRLHLLQWSGVVECG